MLTIDNILRLWSTEDYKKLSRRLIEKSLGDPLQYTHIRSNISDPKKVMVNDIEYNVDEAIAFLDNSMKQFKSLKSTNTKYYRGDTNLLPDKSCMKENYISVSENIEDAITFIDDFNKGYLSEINIEPDVKCIKVGVEGELLLQHGCFWEVKSKSSKVVNDVKYKLLKICVHSPTKMLEYPPCSLLKRNSINSNRKKSIKLNKKNVSKRLTTFYESYVEQAQLLSESENENDFLNTIVTIKNISNESKRSFYRKSRKRKNRKKKKNF